MDTLKQTADAVLDEPIKLTVDVFPVNRLHAWVQKKGYRPKQKTFEISGIKMGTLIRISRILLSIDLTVFDRENLLESNYKAMDMYGEKLAECIALCIHNKKSAMPASLVSFVLSNFTTSELLRVLQIVLKQMDVTSFMSSIISIKGVNILASQSASVKPAE